MEKIKNYIKEHVWIDIVLIAAIMVIFSILFAKNIYLPFIDKGREFFLSEQVLNGKIPFTDITMIYYPFAYYINALIYKILGVSIDSLVISQTFFCTCFAIIFYFLSKEFLSRSISLLLTILVISCSIFCLNDIFSYIMPYSYAAAYGYMSFMVTTFALVKLFKTDEIKFAYFASLAAGFCASCKMEFATVMILLIVSFIFYGKIKFTQYIKILLLFIIFPLIEIGILHFQGVTLYDISKSLEFAKKFATTDCMKNNLGGIGMFPTGMLLKIKYILQYLPNVINIILLSFAAILLYKKYNNPYFMIFCYICICLPFLGQDTISFIWNGLPMILFILFVLFYKKLCPEDKSVLILFVAAIFISQRVFFCLNMQDYGSYPLPLLFLALCTFVSKLCPQQIADIQLKHLINFVLIVLIGLYSYSLIDRKLTLNTPVKSPKGTIYVTKDSAKFINEVLDYINNEIPPNKSILILPEGNIINYMSGRNADTRCFMMDSFYYYAYGAEKSKELIKSTNSDYIFILNIPEYNSNHVYLFDKYTTPVAEYIYKNYNWIKSFSTDSGSESLEIMNKNRNDGI